MAKISVVTPESAMEDAAPKLERQSEDRIRRFEEALRTEKIDFKVDKDETDPDQQLRNYRGNATDGLRRILAAAGEAEARAKQGQDG